MEPARAHWPTSLEEAESLQTRLASQVVREDRFSDVVTVAGVDVAYSATSDRVVAAAAVLDAVTLRTIEVAIAETRATFPYVPGYFSFREAPSILADLDKLTTRPDLVVCDGHGIAHPRRFGLACHLGVVLDLPTIGCAKTRLVGAHDELDTARGSTAVLRDGEEDIGAVLRTQSNVRPVFVSTGHRVSLETACAWVLRLSPRYRLPETTRVADQAVKAAFGATSRPAAN